MKTTLLIYAISWLILLIVYLTSRLGKNRDSGKSKDPWYIYVIIFAIAPITVLIIPYIVWKSAKEEKQRKQRKADAELREKKEEERRNDAERRYLLSSDNSTNGCTKGFIEIAQALHAAVRDKAYDSIHLIMDKTMSPEGAELYVRECNNDNLELGDQSQLLIRFGEEQNDKDAFDFLRFDDSYMGAWQAYLLHQLWHSLPLWWHANYSRRDYLFSAEDLPFVHHMRKEELFPDFSNHDFTPEIYKSGNYYSVSACYWSEFGGLIREYIEMRFEDGRLSEFVNFRNRTIFRYDCGIMF